MDISVLFSNCFELFVFLISTHVVFTSTLLVSDRLSGYVVRKGFQNY